MSKQQTRFIYRLFSPRAHAHSTASLYFFYGMWMFFLLILESLSVGIFSYMMALDGFEEITVPLVEGETLEEALIKLQERELRASIQLRSSNNVFEKGRVLAQEPQAGFTVKMGRDIKLIVSQGSLSDLVPDYVGLRLDSVEKDLREMYVNTRPLLVLGTVSYAQDSTPRGTILRQNPPAGMNISSLQTLDLLVSQGPSHRVSFSGSPVGEYRGLSYLEALSSLLASDIDFNLSLDETLLVSEGIIATQSIEPSIWLSDDERLNLVMKPPKMPEGNLFRILDLDLPYYPLDVDILVKALVSGESRVLYKFSTRGGAISLPYFLPQGSEISVLVSDQVSSTMRVE